MNIPGFERVHIRNGRYYLLVPSKDRDARGKLKRRWIKLTRVDQGLGALEKALADFRATPQPKKGNLPAIVKLYLAAIVPDLTHTVRKEYERMFAKISDEFDEHDIDKITPMDVLDFLGLFVTKLTARRAYKARLSSFFSWCVIYQGLKVNPCAEIRLKQPPKREAKWDAAKYHTMREAMSERDRAFMDLLFLTWQRPTEIRLLRESQITDKIITFKPTKTRNSTGKAVDIEITAPIRAALETARRLRKVRPLRDVDAYLFPATGGTSPLSKTGLHSILRRAREKSGMIDATWKDMRPFALGTLLKNGYTKEQIQRAATHASITTTEIYVERYDVPEAGVELELPVVPKTPE